MDVNIAMAETMKTVELANTGELRYIDRNNPATPIIAVGIIIGSVILCSVWL